MSKRLRGWQLEVQKQEAVPEEHAPHKHRHSALATKLLSLWAHGSLSATACQELAHLALLDGAQHDELMALASCGSWGSAKGNAHRDVLSKFCSDVHICESFEVTVPCRDPKTSELEHQPMSFFLPHMMFSALSSYDEFDTVFATGGLREFWSKVSGTNDDKLNNHPELVGQDWQDRCIPLFLHGDGVEFQDRDSMMVYSWGAILSTRSSQDSSLMLACFPKSCTFVPKKNGDPDTWADVLTWIKWSLEALQTGKHPQVDPFGNSFPPSSPFYHNQGTMLHPKSYKGILWCIEGDHEFFSNTLKLPHWSSHCPCWECDTCIRDETKTWRVIEPEVQQWNVKTHAEAMANPSSDHCFFSIPGVSTKMVQNDLLHVVFTKGILSHLLGSILHLLCWYEGPGAQQVHPEKRLALIFQDIQQCYCEKQAPTRLTNLKISMFTDPKKPHASHPALNSKAAESKHLLHPMLAVCRKALGGHPKSEDIIQSVSAMTDLVDLFDMADVVLKQTEHENAMALCCKFLHHYSILNAWAVSQGTLLFHIVIKFHTFYHLVLSAKHLNPRVAWCFKAEDYVGRIAHLAHSVSMGVKSSRLSLKVALKYRHMLHLRLTRGDFDDE
jgi:hypothetical protein